MWLEWEPTTRKRLTWVWTKINVWCAHELYVNIPYLFIDYWLLFFCKIQVIVKEFESMRLPQREKCAVFLRAVTNMFKSIRLKLWCFWSAEHGFESRSWYLFLWARYHCLRFGKEPIAFILDDNRDKPTYFWFTWQLSHRLGFVRFVCLSYYQNYIIMYITRYDPPFY